VSKPPTTDDPRGTDEEGSKGSALGRLAAFLGIKGGVLGVAVTLLGIVATLHQLGVWGSSSPSTPATQGPGTGPGTPATFPSINFSFPAQPSTQEPSLVLSRSSGPPGTSLTVSGNGSAAGETVEIRFHDLQVGKATADSKGAFGSTAITIPADWGFKGQFDISALGRTSIRHVSEPFQVQ
jgi:hypothetical protein